MAKFVNLKAKPYYLDDEGVKWVEDTIASMTDREKIGQLFFQLFHDLSEDGVKKVLNTIPLGGARYFTKSSEEVLKFTGYVHKHSKIPMLIACNNDNGGDGCCSDGTYIASGAHCEAANNAQVSYNAGYVSGKEATAIGCNQNFDPCSDILYNWRNTIVNTRAYGNNPLTVLKHIRKYVQGLKQSNIVTTIKHFPGDGYEERDQHLLLGVNELAPEVWDKTYGLVYKTMIDDGIMSIMAGHIALPLYQKKFNPSLTDQDILPATLSPELITNLLKEQLDFNGMVVTDASHMVGMTAALPRRLQVPTAIAAGCDMFLFLNDDLQEDYDFMYEGYKNGIITEERLTDALRRILGLKAALGLHKKSKEELSNPDLSQLKVVGCEEHKQMAKQAADLGIALVKDTQHNLPLNPKTHPKLRLYFLDNTEVSVYGKTESKVCDVIVKELQKVGFQVEVNQRGVRQKGTIKKFHEEVDVALVVSDIRGYAVENNYRIRWSCAMANEIPWFVSEVPTVFVSLNYTTHLTDVPMVKTYINAHTNTPTVIEALVQKLIGNSEFKGIYNDNVWCNKWETKR